LDVVRLLAFSAVIAVHALAFTELPDDEGAAGAMMLLEFGREVFLALTGLVLVYAAKDRPVRAWAFWRRRFPLVAIPYLAWTLIYWALTPGGHPSLTTLGTDLLDANAEYHLYFLLLTMQLYLVFPLLMRFVKATEHRAGVVLAAVAGLNLAWLATVQYVPAPAGAGGFWWTHAYELLPTYAMYVLAGAYAARHFERLRALVAQQRARLVVAAAAAAIVAEAIYAVQLSAMAPRSANAVVQPAMAASCVAAIIALYLVGLRWASGKRRGEALVRLGSEISFGVYLAHPLVLQVLLDHGLGNGQQSVPAPVATALAAVGAAGGAIAVCLVLRRTPAAPVLTGRPRVPLRRSLRPQLAPTLSTIS
jgi:peptidoglycan/LPS O-acetylase OafA/YrhL